MNVIDYLNKNNILWEPIIIKFDNGKKIPNNEVSFKGITYMPKADDYKKIKKEEIYKRQQVLEKCEYIAIFTNEIAQLDIDYENKVFDEWKKDTPYFESVKKKMPHFFIKYNGGSKDTDVGEILNGTWSYCKKNSIVYNADNYPKEVDLNYFKENGLYNETREILNKMIAKDFHNSSYNDWIKYLFMFKKHLIEKKYTEMGIIEYLKKFSKASDTKYDENAIKTIENLKEPKEDTPDIKSIIIKKNKSKDSEDKKRNDHEVAKDIIKRNADKIKICEGNIFIKEYDNLWVMKKEETIKSFLLSLFIEEIPNNIDGIWNTIIKAIIALLNITPEIIDDTFYSEKLDNYKDALVFNNGVLFYKNGEKIFKGYEEAETKNIYSSVKIPRNYVIHDEDKLENAKKWLFDNIFNPIFNCDEKCINEKERERNKKLMNEYFLVRARAYMGYFQDKNFLFALGARNSGKGVLTLMDELAFGQYVSSFNLENFLYKPTDNDPEKRLKFLYEWSSKRVVLGNELDNQKDTVLSSSLVKRSASGGDIQKARILYGNSMDIRVRAHINGFFNDMPKFDNTDVFKNVLFFNFPSVFLTPEETEDKVIVGNIRTPDKDIKIKLQEEGKTILYRDAYIDIILNAFMKEPIYEELINGRKKIMSYYEDMNSNNVYEIGNTFNYHINEGKPDANFSVHLETIRKLMKIKGINDGDAVIIEKLQKMGCEYMKKHCYETKIGFKNINRRKAGFIGLSIIDSDIIQYEEAEEENETSNKKKQGDKYRFTQE